jgi:hypothetical protein
MKAFALVDPTGRVVLVALGYWSIINRFKARRAANFYRRFPGYRIKRCTVTVP